MLVGHYRRSGNAEGQGGYRDSLYLYSLHQSYNHTMQTHGVDIGFRVRLGDTRSCSSCRKDRCHSQQKDKSVPYECCKFYFLIQKYVLILYVLAFVSFASVVAFVSLIFYLTLRCFLGSSSSSSFVL
mgnify:CR=1 FL=1